MPSQPPPSDLPGDLSDPAAAQRWLATLGSWADHSLPDGEALSDEEDRDAHERWLATLPESILSDVAAGEMDALLRDARLTVDQHAALDAPWGLAVVPAIAEALNTQQTVMDDLEEIACSALGAGSEAADYALEELRAATANTAAQIAAADAQALRDVQARTAALSRRRASLAAWHRSLLAQMPEGSAERLLYLLALAGNDEARQALADRARARAFHPGRAAQDLLAVQILALLDALDALQSDTARVIRQAAALLAAVVLASALYRCRRDPRPRDLLRGSLELHAPPSLSACSALRGMATAAGDNPRTPP